MCLLEQDQLALGDELLQAIAAEQQQPATAYLEVLPREEGREDQSFQTAQ